MSCQGVNLNESMKSSGFAFYQIWMWILNSFQWNIYLSYEKNWMPSEYDEILLLTVC